MLSGVLGSLRKKLGGWTRAGEHFESAAGCMHCAVYAKDWRYLLMTGSTCWPLVPCSRRAVSWQGPRA